MNQDPVITPNLDQFASEGIVFTHAVSNSPVCSPYRAMLFSGKYPISNGVVSNCYSATIKNGIELKESERCLSDVLHDAGYNQGYIGKLHLDLPKEEHIPYTEGWRGKPGKSTFWDAYTPPGPRRHGFGDQVPIDVEGVDYSRIFLGKDVERPRSALYFAPQHPDLPGYDCQGVRTHGNTFVIKKEEAKETVVLYDNQRDPYQLRNVADKNTELVQELTNELGQWLERTKDPWLKTGKII